MMAIVALATAFVGCSKETDLYNSQATQETEHAVFKQKFIETFGSVSQNVDWGFNESTTTRSTSALVTNRAIPASTGEILEMTYSDISELSETDKRACLRQLADAELLTQVDIRCLRAYGFKRIVAEDLNVSGGDFDYNDVVFDAKRVDDAGTGEYATYYIVLRATGAHKKIVVGNAEGQFEVHEAFGVSQNTFVNTIGKDRGTDTGAYWEKDHAPVFIKLQVAKTANGTEPLLIDIPIYAEGNTLPLTAVKGQPAEKICVDTDYSWLEERQHMQKWYPTFAHYVNGTASSTGDTYESETSWWHYSYWDGEDFTNAVDELIPEETVKKIERYVPIYRGNTPTLFEGAFAQDKAVAVYCSDNYKQPGGEILSNYMRFYNLDQENLTIDFECVEPNNSGVVVERHPATQVLVSGSGNNFTLCYVSNGKVNSSITKEAYIISGTKTASGIKDLYFAFTMLESSVPSQTMKVGEFRSYKDKDGLSVPVTWRWQN